MLLLVSVLDVVRAWADEQPTRNDASAYDGLGGDQPGGRPFLAHRCRRGLRQASDGCSLGDVGGVHGSRSADLGGEQPDGSTAHEIGQGVDEGIDEISVVLAPPEKDGVHDIAVVRVNEVRVKRVLDGDPELVVSVVIPPELLDNHARNETQPARGACGLGGVPTRGRTQLTPPDLCVVHWGASART